MTEALGQLVTVHDGETDVDQCDVGVEDARGFERLRAVVSDSHPVTELLERIPKRSREIVVVVDDQDSIGLQRLAVVDAALRGRIMHLIRAPFGGWKLDDELTALSDAVAFRTNTATVALHQTSHDREPQPQPALRAIE